MSKPDIVYLPLDERPCNLEFAQRIVDGTPIKLTRPDKNILGDKKTPADYQQVEKFLLDNAADADCFIISLDMLLYGGIVPSRLHHLQIDELLERLDTLRKIKAINPKVKIYAFALIMRCPWYSSDDEEPAYYQTCGREIFLTGQVKHKLQLNLIGQDEADKLLEEYSLKTSGFLVDYERRRAINRTMLAKIVLQLNKTIDFLVIPQDDSSPYGYTTMDREFLKVELAMYGVNNVAMYPGADEVGMTLLARAVCDAKNAHPKVYCVFAHENCGDVVPLYEDRPLKDSLAMQIATAGCVSVESEAQADIVLYLNYSSQQPVDINSPSNVRYSDRDLQTFCNKIAHSLQSDKVVALADGAYCNGGDAEMLEKLASTVDLFKLSSYAGWNTSSNTLGTAISQAVLVHLYGKSEAQNKFLAERFYEDVGYCAYARKYITEKVLSGLGYNYFDAGTRNGKVAKIVRDEVQQYISKHFPAVAQRYVIDKCQMPWKRMFEVDLTVKEI